MQEGITIDNIVESSEQTEERKPQQKTIDVINLTCSFVEYEVPENATHIVRKKDNYLVKEVYSEFVIGKKWIPVEGKNVRIRSYINGTHDVDWY